MKSSEAKPLSLEEMKTLKYLMQRWVLLNYPCHGGSSEESDAIQTYLSIESQTDNSYIPSITAEDRKMMEKYGQQDI